MTLDKYIADLASAFSMYEKDMPSQKRINQPSGIELNDIVANHWSEYKYHIQRVCNQDYILSKKSPSSKPIGLENVLTR